METVVEMARRLGWLVYHTFDSRKSAAGFPDLVLTEEEEKGDRLIFAELKSDKGKVSTSQRAWHEALVHTGKCEVYIWRPLDMDLIERILR